MHNINNRKYGIPKIHQQKYKNFKIITITTYIDDDFSNTKYILLTKQFNSNSFHIVNNALKKNALLKSYSKNASQR